MDDKGITKVWTFLGLALAYITLNAWIITQAGDLFNMPMNIFSERLSNQKVATGIFATIICAPMSWYLFYLAIIFKKNKTGIFVNRIPVAFGLNFNTDKLESKIYQYFFFFVFHIFPVLGQIHFLNKFFSKGKPVHWKSDDPISFWSIKQLWLTIKGEKMYGIDCVDLGDKFDCIAFFPLFQPIFLIILVLITVVFTIYFFLFDKIKR